MIKQALGLSLNGRELRLAHIFLDGSIVRVAKLEKVELPSYDENAAPAASGDAFSPDISALESLDAADNSLDEESQTGSDVAAQLVHSLIEPYVSKKIKVGLNVPTTEVRYEETSDVEAEQPLKQNFLDKLSFTKKQSASLKSEFIFHQSDQHNIKIMLDSSTPFLLAMLERQNVFFQGNLVISHMLPNELSLLQLCQRSSYFSDNKKVTIIIQVEDDFSHLIFLVGKEFRSATPFFGEFEGEGLLNVLYSKIIYELDHWQVDDIDNVLLASNAANEQTLKYFQEKLPGTMVSYIISSETDLPLSSMQPNNELSEYALAIALAWQAIDPTSKQISSCNVLPQRILDNQKALRLSTPGIILLAVLGLSTLGSTLFLLNKQLENRKLKNENAYFEMEIKANEPIIDQVRMFENKIAQLAQVTTQADSLIDSYSDVLLFFQKANQSMSVSDDFWVNEIINTKSGFKIIGQSRIREAIPILSNALGRSVLRRVYPEFETEPVYFFEIDLIWPSEPSFFPTPLNSNTQMFAQKLNPFDPESKIQKAGSDNQDRQNLFQRTASGNSSIQNMKYYKEPENKIALDPGQFTIVLEEISDLGTAKEFIEQIKEAGYDVFLRQSGVSYFICTESFPDRAAAQQKLENLKAKNIPKAEIVDLDGFRPVIFETSYADNTVDDDFIETNEQQNLQLTPLLSDASEEMVPFAENDASTISAVQTESPLGPPDLSTAFQEAKPEERADTDAIFENSKQTAAYDLPTVVDIQTESPIGPPATSTFTNESTAGTNTDTVDFYERLEKVDPGLLAGAPTVRDIQTGERFGPPADEAFIAALEESSLEISQSQGDSDPITREELFPESLDSQMQPEREAYSVSPQNAAPEAELYDKNEPIDSDFYTDEENAAVNNFALTSPPLQNYADEPDERIEFRKTDRYPKIYVLAGNHISSGDAIKDVAFLNKFNIETTILDLRVQGKPRPFWVCLGEFENLLEAKLVIEKLQHKINRNYKVKVLDREYFTMFKYASENI